MKAHRLADDEENYWLAYERVKEKPKPIIIPYKKMVSPLDYKVGVVLCAA